MNYLSTCIRPIGSMLAATDASDVSLAALRASYKNVL
jgi:hypothetical protein